MDKYTCTRNSVLWGRCVLVILCSEANVPRKLQPRSTWYLIGLSSLATTQREYVALHAFCFCRLSVQLAEYYIALAKMEHQMVPIAAASRGSRADHRSASPLQAAMASTRVVLSLLKTTLLHLFQICHQDNNRKVPKCFFGI